MRIEPPGTIAEVDADTAVVQSSPDDIEVLVRIDERKMEFREHTSGDYLGSFPEGSGWLVQIPVDSLPAVASGHDIPKSVAIQIPACNG